MKQIILFLLLIASGAAFADPNTSANLDQLKAELSSVQQEQQSVYQNSQMTKELRRNEIQEGSQPIGSRPMMQNLYGTGTDTLPQNPEGTLLTRPCVACMADSPARPPLNYGDVLRAQQEREQRIQQYTGDLSRLSARFLELESQEKLLLKQIQEMEQHPDNDTQ